MIRIENVKPIWRFKLRKMRSHTGEERVVKIPNEVVQNFGNYVEITIENGRLVIYPVKEEIKK